MLLEIIHQLDKRTNHMRRCSRMTQSVYLDISARKVLSLFLIILKCLSSFVVSRRELKIVRYWLQAKNHECRAQLQDASSKTTISTEKNRVKFGSSSEFYCYVPSLTYSPIPVIQWIRLLLSRGQQLQKLYLRFY